MIVGPTNALVCKYFWRLVDHATDQGYDMSDIKYPDFFKCRGEWQEPFTKRTTSQRYFPLSVSLSLCLYLCLCLCLCLCVCL